MAQDTNVPEVRAQVPVPGTARNIVLVCGGLSLLRCFRGSGVPVVAADSDPGSLTLYSRHIHSSHMIACPRTQPEQSVADLVALGKRFLDRPMLAFDNEPTLMLVSRHRDILSRYYRFLLPDSELIEDLTCKLRFAALASRLDLPVPRSLIPTDRTTVDGIAEQIGFPCVLKPSSHVGRFCNAVEHDHHFAYKALRADTLDELRRDYEQMRTYCDSFVIQQYVPGDDTCLYSFHAYLDRNSTPLGFFVGRKIRTYPKDAGGSTYLELVHDLELVNLSMQLLRKINYVGPIKIDFKKDPLRNKWYILECNTRFTLWNYLGAACGANLPQIALADLYDEPVKPPSTYRTGIRWLSFGNDLRAFVREYRRDGDWTWPQWLWSLRSRKIYEVFSWRDPKPWLVCALRYARTNRAKLALRFRPRTARLDQPPRPQQTPVVEPKPVVAPVALQSKQA